jgi:hypothetical protein
MLPRDLKAELFSGYPPEAKKVVVAHLEALRPLPLSFVPSLLREVIEYDYKFPVERAAIDRELGNLSSLTPAQIEDWFGGFAKVSLSSSLEQFDWINAPAQFVERQSAYLWSTHQLDAFSKAAMDYGTRLQAIAPPESPTIARLGIAVIGQGVASYDGQLFRNLRAHGTYFSQIDPENGLELLLAEVEARAKQHPGPYAHWYVDGAGGRAQESALTRVSYDKLEPLRTALLKRMQAEIQMPGMGPEELRTHMAQLTPVDLGMNAAGDAVLDRFQLKLFTEGSGTQIYSTTFAQWTTREVLRRAQAVTLLVRFTPRQRQRPMNELLADPGGGAELDLVGSLIDGDMGAYYHWINQQRLSGSERSVFIAWFEGHSRAVVVSPSLPRNTESKSALNLKQLFALAVG